MGHTIYPRPIRRRTSPTRDRRTIRKLPSIRTRIERRYGSRDKHRIAVRQLQQLRQVGPASQYTATFRRLALDSGWNEAALITHYYIGLRDSIEDELSRSERPDTINELIDRVLTINERFFERQNGTRKVWRLSTKFGRAAELLTIPTAAQTIVWARANRPERHSRTLE